MVNKKKKGKKEGSWQGPIKQMKQDLETYGEKIEVGILKIYTFIIPKIKEIILSKVFTFLTLSTGPSQLER